MLASRYQFGSACTHRQAPYTGTSPSHVVLAVGTTDGGGGFEDNNAELVVLDLDTHVGEWNTTFMGKLDAQQRVGALAWTKDGTKLLGGMSDGTLRWYDVAAGSKTTTSPKAIPSNTPKPLTAPVATIKLYEKNIKAISASPVDANLVATGGADKVLKTVTMSPAGKIVVEWSDPATFCHGAEISDIAWNTENSHILASCAVDGSTTIWDTKTKKSFAQIKDPRGAPTTVVTWNPRDGSQLVVASDDPTVSTLRLFDLRSSKTTPLFEFNAPAGIFDVSWCPHDPSLLASCGKDNKVHLWDMSLLEQVNPPIGYEFSDEAAEAGGRTQPILAQPSIGGGGGGSNTNLGGTGQAKFGQRSVFGGVGGSSAFGGAMSVASSSSDSAFGGGGGIAMHGNTITSGGGPATATSSSGTASSRRYELQWSPVLPGVLTACSFDRSIQVLSLVSSSSKSVAKPRNNSMQPPQQGVVIGAPPSWLRRGCGASFGFGGKLVVFGTKLEATVEIQNNVAERDTASRAREFEHNLSRAAYHDEQAQTAEHEHLKAFCLERARASKDDTDRDIWRFFTVLFAQHARMEIEKFLGYDEEAVAKEYDPSFLPLLNEQGKVVDEQGNELVLPQEPLSTTTTISDEATNIDNLIMRTLVVGNFEAAVCLCFQHGRDADALMLAALGGNHLIKRAQRAFLDRQTPTRPLMRVAQAIYNDDMELVTSRFESTLGGPKKLAWKQALALLATYAKQENFVLMCNDLAQRLEAMPGMSTPATLCYMLARNVGKTVELWAGRDDVELMEKALVFQRALPNPSALTDDPKAVIVLARLAAKLADEGELDLAAKYAHMGAYGNPEAALLVFRVFASHPAQEQLVAFLGQVPQFPYPIQIVGAGVQSQQPVHHHTSPQLYGQALQPLQQQQQPQQPQYGYGQQQYGGATAPPQQQQYQPQYGGGAYASTQPSTYGGGGAPPPTSAFQQPYQQPSHTASHFGNGTSTNTLAAPPQFAGYAPPPQPDMSIAAQQQPLYAPALSVQQPSNGTWGMPTRYQQPPSSQPPPPVAIPATYSSPGPKIRENDGFGTTAGNPDAGAKYGNRNAFGGGGGDYQQQQFQQQQQQQPQLPPKPIKPRDDMIPALGSFQRLMEQLRHAPRPLTGPEERQMKEVERAEEVLRTSLSNGRISDYVCTKIKEMAGALDRGQFHEAQNTVVALTSTDWNDNKDWLKGIRHLVILGMRDEKQQQPMQAVAGAGAQSLPPPRMPMAQYGPPVTGGGPPIPQLQQPQQQQYGGPPTHVMPVQGHLVDPRMSAQQYQPQQQYFGGGGGAFPG